jgi:hypothetical protein
LKKVFEDLPGWSFDVDERSAGLYEVIASDRRGRRFSMIDADPWVLLERGHKEALEQEQRARKGT